MTHCTYVLGVTSLYKRSATQFHKDQFDHLILDMYTGVVSFDDEKYICKICKTCAKKKIKHASCQAVINKLTNLPNQFCDICILEKVLVSKWS